MDGRSLLPVIQIPATDRNRDLLIEQPALKAIRTPATSTRSTRTASSELYDLQNDPFELQSLARATAYASVKSTLRFRLHQLESCAGAELRHAQARPPGPMIRGRPVRVTGAMGRRGSLLTAILATLAITGSLVVAGSSSHAPTLGQAAAAGRPNVLVIETDDQTLESMKVMQNVNS